MTHVCHLVLVTAQHAAACHDRDAALHGCACLAHPRAFKAAWLQMIVELLYAGCLCSISGGALHLVTSSCLPWLAALSQWGWDACRVFLLSLFVRCASAMQLCLALEVEGQGALG
jgi:hypothetical protein